MLETTFRLYEITVASSCDLDTVTIYDGESLNANIIVEVICGKRTMKPIKSTGTDMVIEFNASSNVTSRGFRGKFRYIFEQLKTSNVSEITPFQKPGKFK